MEDFKFMVVDKVIANINGLETTKIIDKVPVEWFEASKKRFRKTSEQGCEVGICVNSPLNDGDILYQDDGKIIIVDIVPSEVVKIVVTSMQEMGKLCFQIGNRHLSLKINIDSVLIPYDAPTYEYLLKLGFNAKKTLEKFTGFTECKAHESSTSSYHKHHHEHKHIHVDAHGNVYSHSHE